jgi:cell division protein FtsQ
MNARKKRAPNRRRAAVALVVLAAAVISVIGFVSVREVRSPRLALGSIDVSGARSTSISEILRAAALPGGSNIWLLDTTGAEGRIEALPWIATASVRRTWPNNVSILVTERVPVGRLLLPGGGSSEEPAPQVALIDASMRVLAIGESVGIAADLPLFRIVPQPYALQPGATLGGDDAAHAYDAMVELRALGLRISEVDLKPSTGVTVTCDGGLRVILGGDDDLAKKVSLLKAIAPKISAPEDVVYVDLRSVRAPTVLYR